MFGCLCGILRSRSARSVARALITEQFPELDVTSLRRDRRGLGQHGVGDRREIAFRFPRRAIAVPGVQREMVVLPELAGLLPAPIPDAGYVGAPGDLFPWPWFGSRLIVGQEVALAGIPAAGRIRFARELGEFLGALHRLGPSIAPELKVDPMGRARCAPEFPRREPH